MRTTEIFHFRMLGFSRPLSLRPSSRSPGQVGIEDCNPRLIWTQRVLQSRTLHSIENTSQHTCTYSIIIIIIDGCYVLSGQRWYFCNIIHKSQANDLWNRIIICDMPNSHYYHILFIRFHANVLLDTFGHLPTPTAILINGIDFPDDAPEISELSLHLCVKIEGKIFDWIQFARILHFILWKQSKFQS